MTHLTSAWKSRVEAAILAVDRREPMTHGPDLRTPLTLMIGVVAMQSNQARRLHDAYMAKASSSTSH